MARRLKLRDLVESVARTTRVNGVDALDCELVLPADEWTLRIQNGRFVLSISTPERHHRRAETVDDPDPRATWNAVERLARIDRSLASDLADVLRDPRIEAALIAVAGANLGGFRLAEQAADAALREPLRRGFDHDRCNCGSAGDAPANHSNWCAGYGFRSIP